MNSFRHAFCLLAIFIFASCSARTDEKTPISEDRDLSGFIAVNVNGNIEIELLAGKPFAVNVTAPAKVLPQVRTSVEDEVLKIRLGPGTSDAKIRISISMPELRSFDATGSVSAIVREVNVKDLRLRSGGSTSIRIDGTIETLDLETTGSSRVDGLKLMTTNAAVKASGSSSVEIAVRSRLEAETLGAASIRFDGNPTVQKAGIGGAGKIERIIR